MAAAVLGTVLVLGASAAAQQPRIVNGTVTTEAARPPLVQQFRALVSGQTEIAWIGYSVPVAKDYFESCGNSVGLEMERPTRVVAGSSATSPGPVKLESGRSLLVFFRIVDRRVDRLRTFSDECELDAGVRTVRWIEHVTPTESVALLEDLVARDAESGSRSIRSGALAAMALHGGAATSTASETMIRLARTAADARVRGDALFWLAQMAGAKAVGTITERIDQDPDTEVKRKAVFALSQLPRDEGVALLIDVARNNRNPAVRKQAMFWLGQSKDPRRSTSLRRS
jgi:hypothetical protein